MSDAATAPTTPPMELEFQAGRRFGCGLLLMAPLIYAVVFIGAFSDQALFFTMEDYLNGPKATAEMPKIVGLFVAAVTIVGGLTAIVFPLLAGALAIYLLFSGKSASALVRLCLIILPVPVISLAIHTLVLLAFYVYSQGHLPKSSEEILPVVMGGYVATLGALGVMWIRTRRRWPRWNSSLF